MNAIKLLILGCWLSFPSWAQQGRYMVFFTDKTGTPYQVDQPKDFLSAKAISRREGQNIAITEEDLPVNPDYVRGLSNEGVQVLFASRWVNGALVQMDDADIPAVEGLTYVSTLKFVGAPTSFSSGRKKNRGARTKSVANQQQNKMLGIDALHAMDIRGEGITIAVFDGGFTGGDNPSRFGHIFENNRLRMAVNIAYKGQSIYQYTDHGTRVWSVMAGFDPNFEGAAHNADYMLFVTEEVPTEYRVEEYNWLIAAEIADSAGVDIINTSLGYTNAYDDPFMDYEYADMDGQSTVITKAANLAAAKGILIVCSVGNEGSIPWRFVNAPADSPNVMAVGSVNSNLSKSSFSSFGPTFDGRTKPEVAALGSGTIVISGSGSTVSASGTSFSTPLISGLSALVWQANPELTNLELIDLIKSMGSNTNTPDNEIGHGIPNYNRLILGVENELKENDFKVYPNPVNDDILFIEAINPVNTILSVSLFDQSGREIMKVNGNALAKSQRLSMNLGAFVNGNYFVVVDTGEKSFQYRIIKP